MTDPSTEPSSVSVVLEQTGKHPAKAEATAMLHAGPSILQTLIINFLNPTALASVGATYAGLHMLVTQSERAETAWMLIISGGLLSPALEGLRRIVPTKTN